jgi:hypothetical protein
MPGRATLLILTTGLFAAAWSSDREPGLVIPGKPVPRPYRTESIRETTLHRWMVRGVHQTTNPQAEWTPTINTRESQWESDRLPSGTYVVVDDQGQTTRVVVPPDPRRRQLPASAIADHFVTEWNGKRQHWIRLSDSHHDEQQSLEVRIDWFGLWKELDGLCSRSSEPRQGGTSWQRLLSPIVLGLTSLRAQEAIPVAAEPKTSRSR